MDDAQSQMDARPLVAVISLGGTIAMTRSGSGSGGVTPTLQVQDLIAAVPGLGDVARIEALSFRQLPGAELRIGDLEALSLEICRRIDAGAAGVVVTQGTDTIDESAFALDLLVDRPAPVVVTGAMRNPTLPGADGAANLLAAVQVAASREARDLGTLVVLNDEIHAARFVRKTHTASPSTFRSPLLGPLGWVIEGRVRIAARVEAHTHIALGLGEGRRAAAVALLTVSLGDDGSLVDAALERGYSGLVVEAFGGGHVPGRVAERLEEAARRVPVVLASRAGSGEILSSTYGFPGSETDLLSKGLIRAGYLDGPKARILLLLLLRSGAAPDDIRLAFAEWTGG